MACGQVVMRARYKNNGVKDPGVQGVLIMTEDKLDFSPDDLKSSSARLSVGFRYITNQRISQKQALLRLIQKPTSGSTQSSAPDVKVDSEKSSTILHDEQLRLEEIELRMKVLAENSELQKLHKQFVIGGVLDESEFWATRKRSLGVDGSKMCKQRLGFKSAMLANVRPLTDDRKNKIFTEKPAVHQAFLKFVPSKMTEMDFWTKYGRAEFLHKTKMLLRLRLKLRVDPTLDMEADEGDDYIHLPDNGIFRDGCKETLAQDLNRHAAVVLEGRTLDMDLGDTRTVAEALAKSKKSDLAAQISDEKANHNRLERASRMVVIEDLHTPHNLPFAPLLIKDPREYFDSQQVNVLKSLGDTAVGTKTINCNLNTEQAYGFLRNSISEIKVTGLHDPIIDPEVASTVLIGSQQLSSTKYNLGKNPQESILDVPKKTEEELLHYWISIQELLKHFWSSYPITTTYLNSKVSRLKDAMANIYPKQQRIKESEQSCFRHQVSLLVQPMVQALDAAFSHYDADLQKRSMRS
ncbi:hypothetical protein MKW98_032359 [Papaver atlanticum]|uniref:BSD domain-containing protein n=1 Tax=Papaver atlanticum TaxID=357466 RepID=A0AAD4XCN8_9MAGN|nr:hypothetical protein MKW98_032359 [Papaver atlanticum]